MGDSSGGGTNPVTDWPARAGEVGVDLISAMVCALAHMYCFTVETDDITKINNLFRPYLGFAEFDITPVRDLMNP